MDSEEEREMDLEILPERKKGCQYVTFRLILALIFFTFLLFSSSMFIAFISVLFGHLSITSPIYFPSQCRILSSSVDLKSSKVCELGLLNFKAKRVFYPFEGSKFRCRYDYYWASVFEVEYKDYSLGQTRLAFAEAPNEALPINCRPNFGSVWLTKDKFKVNKTYDCWYTVGFSKVSLYPDGFFPCQAKDPSIIEMMRRYIVLFIKSWFEQKKAKTNEWMLGAVGGIVAGFLTSVISVKLISILRLMKSRLAQTYIAQLVATTIQMIFLRRACFLVAYFSVVGWLVIQYGKRLGIPEIYRIYYY
ncbi:uncharacterized protein [Euphorbia lathyris]|uniref:uncharacterized protein isoform X1 n=1 Tax=Euphorbia lathyris TaxID=212925 RepID=UPI00331406EE